MKEFFRNLIKPTQKTENKEAKKGPNGLDAYKLDLERAVAKFESIFDPKDRTKTEDIYRSTKRAQALFQGALMEIIYSGVVRRHTKEKRTRVQEERRRANQRHWELYANSVIAHFGELIVEIEKVIPPGVLAKTKAEIIILRPGFEPGVDMNDNPRLKKYIHDINDMVKKGEKDLEPLLNIEGAAAIIRPEDLQVVASIHRTLREDLKGWQAISLDFRADSAATIDGSVLSNVQEIEYVLTSKIVDKHERAFSKDGLSESDKGIAYILGAKIDPKDVRPLLDDEVVNTGTVSESFNDPRGYFRILKLSPKDLIGKKEGEIKKILKQAYYPLAKDCHPDLNPGDKVKEEKFKGVSEAFETLLDPKKRFQYLAS